MSGFGKKKKEKVKASKSLKKLSEKELKIKSINNHIEGNKNEAEKGYISFISKGYSDADIYSNYALLCEEKGEKDKAIKIYEDCIYKFPNHNFSKINLSYLYYEKNNLEKAKLLSYCENLSSYEFFLPAEDF